VFHRSTSRCQWDGSQILWTYRGRKAWYPLTSAQFLLAAEFWIAARRSGCAASRRVSHCGARARRRPVWTGLFVESAGTGASSCARRPNAERNFAFDLYEGIVESDRWFARSSPTCA